MSTKALYQESISQEAIAFQGNRSLLFNELTARFSMLIASGKWAQADLDRLKLSDVVAKVTGLNIEFRVVTSEVNASAKAMVFDVNNPLLDRFRALGYNTTESIDDLVVSYRKITSFTKELTGSIDRKNGRVSGVFSKILNTIHIGTGLWATAGLTAEEVAASTIHEIGHIFTFLETLTQTATTNLVLQSATQALSKTDKTEVRLALIYETEQALDVKLENPQSLAQDKLSNTTIQAVFLKSLMDKKLHAAGNSATYDLRSSEFAADQFTARHGAGRAMITGSDKIHRVRGDLNRLSTPVWVIIEAARLALIVLLTIGFPVTSVLFHAIFFMFGNPEARVVDDPKERFTRIRNDLVQSLKDRTLPKSAQDQLVADIEFIDKAIVGVNDHRSLYNYLWIALTPGRRQQFNQMRFQQELEHLVNNDMFIKAAQLTQQRQ